MSNRNDHGPGALYPFCPVEPGGGRPPKFHPIFYARDGHPDRIVTNLAAGKDGGRMPSTGELVILAEDAYIVSRDGADSYESRLRLTRLATDGTISATEYSDRRAAVVPSSEEIIVVFERFKLNTDVRLYLARLRLDGAIVASALFDPTELTFVRDIAVMPDGSIVILGIYSSKIEPGWHMRLLRLRY